LKGKVNLDHNRLADPAIDREHVTIRRAGKGTQQTGTSIIKGAKPWPMGV